VELNRSEYSKLSASEARPRRQRKVQKDPPKYLNDQEIENLLKAIGSDARDRAMFSIAACRGLRASEVGNLNMADYHEVAGRPPVAHLMIRRLKGSRHREYELTPEEHTAMRAYLRIRGVSPGPLFQSRNHRAISRRRLDELMKQHCLKAGIPVEKAHMHALKHHAGVHVLAITGDVMAVQFHLGHADLRSSLIYTQFTQEQQLAEKLKDWQRKKK